MSFQFMCPQGHLLQGDPAHMGMQCQCPHCGIVFIIPRVEMHYEPAPAAPQYPQFETYGQPAAPTPQYEPQFESPAPAAAPAPQAEIAAEVVVPEVGGPGAAPQFSSSEATPQVLHIPCPNGHELETPLDMLGQEVLCPHCQAQFHLRSEDSVEYKHQQEIILAKRSEAWFKWSIIAAVVVTLGLITMMIVASQSN